METHIFTILFSDPDKQPIRELVNVPYCSDKNLVYRKHQDFYTNFFKQELNSTYPNYFVKIKWVNEEEASSHQNELNILSMLKGTNLSPDIIGYGQLAKMSLCNIDLERQSSDEYFTCYYIVMSHCGMSVNDMFFPENKKNKYLGPGTYIDKDLNCGADHIMDEFPIKYIPAEITDKIITILSILVNKYKIVHEDIHSGNFVIDKDGIVRAIDFENVRFIN